MSAVETGKLSGQDTAVTAYMALCGLALGAILLVLLQRLPGGRVIWALFPILIGLLGLVTRWMSTPLMFLLILAACLHLQSHRSFVTDTVLCTAVLAYVTGHCRLQSLMAEVFPADPRRREERRRGWWHLWRRPRIVQQRRDARSVSREEIAMFLFALPLWTAAAQVCLPLLSQNWGNPGLQKPAWWLMLLAWAVGGGAFLAAAFIGFWQRSKMTAEEAALFLQDTYWHETRGEQRRINRWLAWARLRRRRKEDA